MNYSDCQAPHCDAAVLHAPGECEYCDDFSEWQRAREAWRIAYTGKQPTEDELPCPSDVRRPGGVANRWPGNQAKRRD